MCASIKKKSSIDDVTKSDLKTHVLRAFQTVNFFDNWHMDRLFLSLSVRKKSSNITHYASKTKIANSSKIYVQIFSCSFGSWNCLDVYSASPKTKKIHRVET